LTTRACRNRKKDGQPRLKPDEKAEQVGNVFVALLFAPGDQRAELLGRDHVRLVCMVRPAEALAEA
jgi:hypothetical protein